MSEYPCFLSIDLSEGEQITPYAIAWSLPDGQIKSTLISPDESWDIDELPAIEFDADTLFDQGATPKEIILELLDDNQSQSIFVFDPYLDEMGLVRVFDSVDRELDVEIAQWLEALDEQSEGDPAEQLGWVFEQYQLDRSIAEERVKAMLLCYDSLHHQRSVT